ncbi:MAG: amidohydrolase family protein [Anaerolineales bacterium]|nr:amidohydrolase family protein [Anaerolineales bacterium]
MMMKKRGVNAVWDSITNLAAGRTRSYEYPRQPLPEWNVGEEEYLFLHNLNILDVDVGKIRDERGLLVRNRRIEELVLPQDFESVRANYRIEKEIDGDGQYLIPGLSDLHCHVSLVSEFGAGLKEMSYWDAQRLKNSEETLKQGCTFIRDCGGSWQILEYLKSEIEANRLPGPRIMTSHAPITPRGGMWDEGVLANYLAPLFFGGKMFRGNKRVGFPRNEREILDVMAVLDEGGCDFFKTYFEDKPIYGHKQTTVYTMFSPQQARLIRERADQCGKKVAAHSLFIKGSRRAIEAGLDTLEHCTVDAPYTLDDAKTMAQRGIAIVPTLSIGCFLAMECGGQGYPDDPEVRFFAELRKRNAVAHARQVAVPQLWKSYQRFFEWLDTRFEVRKMPIVGKVYPERVHGFAHFAPESIRNFQEAGVRVGVGTDGGTGITFCGFLENEFEALHRYGYSKAQVLRMATLGNMEILGLEDNLGSLEEGKYADMVLLDDNPFEDLIACKKVRMVFKDGRLVYEWIKEK